MKNDYDGYYGRVTMEFRNIFTKITLYILLLVSTNLAINGAQVAGKALQVLKAFPPSAAEASVAAASASTGAVMAGSGYLLGQSTDHNGRPILATTVLTPFFHVVSGGLNLALTARDRIINLLKPEQPLLKLPDVPSAIDLVTTSPMVAASPLAAPTSILQQTAELPPTVQSGLSLDGTAILAAVAALIFVSKVAFNPTEQFVNEAIETWQALYEDPLGYLSDPNNKNLEQIKSIFLKALGIQDSLLNVDSYLQRHFIDKRIIGVSEDSYLGMILNNERSDVEKFLEEAKKIENVAKNEIYLNIHKELKFNIRLTLIKIYIDLLKIKCRPAYNGLHLEEKKEQLFTFEEDYKKKISDLNNNLDIDKTNITELNAHILKISSTNYKPSDSIRKKMHSPFNVYDKITSYYENPKRWYPEQKSGSSTQVNKLTAEIKKEEVEVIRELFGGFWFNTFADYKVRNDRTPYYLEAEKEAFRNFYNKLASAVNVTVAAFPEEEIKSSAHYLAFLILRCLRVDQKLLIVEDFLTQSNLRELEKLSRPPDLPPRPAAEPPAISTRTPDYPAVPTQKAQGNGEINEDDYDEE